MEIVYHCRVSLPADDKLQSSYSSDDGFLYLNIIQIIITHQKNRTLKFGAPFCQSINHVGSSMNEKVDLHTSIHNLGSILRSVFTPNTPEIVASSFLSDPTDKFGEEVSPRMAGGSLIPR